MDDPVAVQDPSAAAARDPAAAPLPQPGWYPDPAGRHAHRWWAGATWTDSVADGDRRGTDPRPPRGTDQRAVLPGRAGWYALAGVVAAPLLATAGLLAARQLAPASLVLRLLLSQAGLWTALLGACVLASRRWGTGRLRVDYGIDLRRADVGRGLVVALGARAVVLVATVLLVALAPRLVGTNTGIFDVVRADRAALVALAVLTVVGAPLVEETFFRGLLLRSLRSRLGAPLAVAVQALAFGAAHVDPSRGWRNVGVVLALVLAGTALGAAAEHYRRLGPGMWAHAWFNLLPVAVLLAAG